jgi:two-component system, LytTR family, response regulator
MSLNDHRPNLTVMLVDDERLSRVLLRRLLEQVGGVSIVAEADDLDSARALLESHRPQLLFLDVQLSPGSGFDLLPDLPPDTALVFLTAHSQFAVKAFQANALDYLLKPPSVEKLTTLLEKVRATTERPGANRSVFVGNKSDWIRLPVSQIAAITADGVYSRIVTRAGIDHLMQRSLNHWTTLLEDSGFVRIDRSLLVNPATLQSFRSLDRDHSLLEIEGFPAPLTLGRAGTYRARRLWEEAEEPT